MEYLKSYCLHDTTVNRIELQEKGISLAFDKGIYRVDGSGKETELTGACAINIQIDYFEIGNPEEHIQVYRIYKERIKEFSFDEFIKQVNGASFDVYMCYYSDFSSALLIKGFIGKYKIVFEITEIKQMEIKEKIV